MLAKLEGTLECLLVTTNSDRKQNCVPDFLPLPVSVCVVCGSHLVSFLCVERCGRSLASSQALHPSADVGAWGFGMGLCRGFQGPGDLTGFCSFWVD